MTWTLISPPPKRRPKERNSPSDTIEGGSIMVATEYDLTVVELENEKPEFNVVSFSALIERINTHPELLSNDWRELVKSEFRLSFEQEQSLVRVSGERVQEIQSSLAYFGQE